MFANFTRRGVWRSLTVLSISLSLVNAYADDITLKYDDSMKATLANKEQDRIDIMISMTPNALPLKANDIPARVTAVQRAGDRILNSLPKTSYKVKRRWSAVAGMVLNIDINAVAQLARHQEVTRIGTDLGAGKGNLDESLVLTNFDQVDTTYSLTGTNRTVAVLDSGIDTDHVDLQGSLIGERCFAEGGAACPNGALSAEDDFGHGSAVAGVITSDGMNSPQGGARDTQIFAVKVLDSNNSFSSTQFVVDGLDFVITSGIEFDAVNMSLGTFANFPGDCDNAATFTTLLANAVNTLYAMGTISVVSSGNQGVTTAMQAPACVANALSVGASNDGGNRLFDPFNCGTGVAPADSAACYSNSSTTTDIFAPGSEIRTAFNNGGSAFWHGTSFAAPTVTACVALLREADPTLTPAQLETAIETTNATVQVGASTFKRLDCLAAIESVIVSDSDADGIADDQDNCIDIANTDQRDTNGDNFGNLCDPDLDNNGVVNFIDVNLFVMDFGTVANGDTDFNGDGFVNFLDFALFPNFFLQPPGPSGIAP